MTLNSRIHNSIKFFLELLKQIILLKKKASILCRKVISKNKENKCKDNTLIRNLHKFNGVSKIAKSTNYDYFSNILIFVTNNINIIKISIYPKYWATYNFPPQDSIVSPWQSPFYLHILCWLPCISLHADYYYIKSCGQQDMKLFNFVCPDMT